MGIFGNIGEGKSLLAGYFAYRFHLQNLSYPELKPLPIYCNFKIDYPEAELIDVSRLLDLESLSRGLLVIDEAYSWLESRISQSRINRYVSYFGFQSRKRGVDVIYTAQMGSSIDVRFIDLSHIRVLCKKNDVDRVFGYRFLLEDGKSTSFDLGFDDAKLFWDDYDTYETVQPLGLKELQVDAEKFDSDKINSRVDVLVNRFFEYKDVLRLRGVGDVYRYVVEDILLLWNEPVSLAPFVCNRLKNLLRLCK